MTSGTIKYMLTQKHRFHGHGSLRYLYKNGTAVRSSFITVKYIENPRRKNSRFTVVISKKVVKSAVRRNRLRRRIYEIIRLELPNMKDHRDVAVMVFSSEVYNIDSKSLVRLIKTIFSQASLYK